MEQNTNAKDLRVSRTRTRIQEALLNLTVEKGYTAIKVQDIVDRADVNRSTFYRHYLDKEDLLSKYMEEVINVTFKDDVSTEEINDAEAAPSGLIKLLKHIQIFKEFYRVMLSANGHPVVSEYLRQKVEKRFREHVIELGKTRCTKSSTVELQLKSMSAAGIGAILWWVENNTPCSAEELALWMSQLSRDALVQAFALPQSSI